MSNPDTILFSGTGELTATNVATLLTTEKYVTIEGYNSIAPNAFKDKTDILTVTISNSVTTIGQDAFTGNNCNNITLPVRFFNDAKNTTIFAAALTTNTTKYNFTCELTTTNNSITTSEVTTQLYGYTPGLTLGGVLQSTTPSLDITFDSSVEEFNEDLSFLNTNISSVLIPDVSSIGSSVFAGDYRNNNTTLSSVTFVKTNTKNLNSIGEKIFNKCSALQYIILPDYITSIGEVAFNSCSKLLGSPNNDILNLQYITSIEYGAFGSCSSLTSVLISEENLTAIGAYAFSGCYKLENIVLPINNTYTDISNNTFGDCTSLSAINIPKNITSIGVEAFLGCSKLNTVYLNNGLTSIGEWAFANCGIVTINTPPSLTVIGSKAFNMCPQLSILTLPIDFALKDNIDTTWKIDMFGPDSTGTIAEDGYYNQTASNIKIEYYYIFDSQTPGSTILTQMDVFTLINKYKLSDIYTIGTFNVYIADDITIIDTDAFKNVKNLLTVSLCPTVQEIKSGAFEGSGLQNFYIGTNIDAMSKSVLTTIGDNAFNNCKITSIIIPDSVTELGSWIFYNATELKEVIFSSSTKIDTINSYSFANCASLEILRIPTSVQHINEYAFAYCSNLLDIILPSSLETIGTCAFIDCTTVSTLSLPYHITTIGNNAFGNISFPNNSNISISSLFKDSINSLFNSQIYTGTAKTAYDTYQTNIILYNYYVWVKNGMTAIAESTIGSKDSSGHTLGNQIGFFSDNSTYIALYQSEFDQSANAKRFAAAYIKVDDTTGSSTADKNIETNYFSMKNSSMKLSTMPSTYEDISNNVFDYHYDLQSDTDTDTLTRQQVINQLGSDGTTSTFTATLDNSITIIEPDTFENMNIMNIEFNNDLTQIKSSAFKGSKLTGTLSIPSSVQSIGDYAFQDCSGITMIILPEGNLTTIGQSAFNGCGIQNIYIPKSVTSIGDSICKICSSLTTVTLPLHGSGNDPTYETVAAYEDDVTSGWGIGGGNTTNTSLQYFDNGNDNINITYEFLITINPILNDAGAEPIYEITQDVVNTAIGHLTHETNPVSISVLIKHADISITDKIVISNYAFKERINLHRITMHYVSSIGVEAFYGCSKLKSISIENSIETIGSNAFNICTNLQTVKIPSRLFDKCNINYFTSNKSIIYLFYCILTTTHNEGILYEYDVYTQLGVDKNFNNTISVTFDTTVNVLNDNAFNGNNTIDTIIIPPNIELIGESAFANCVNLSSVICINSNPNLTQIGTNAFNGCTNLTTVHLPLSLLDIGLGVFLNCPNLWSVTLPKIFDYDLLTMNNLYFESNMMKNESWQSDKEWSAEGDFFTFNFELRSGKYLLYSWVKNNYMAQQRAKQAGKVAAHEKVIHKWDKVGELTLAVVLVAAIIFAPEAGAALVEWWGADAAATGTTDAAVTTTTDDVTSSSINDASNSVNNASSASGGISGSDKNRYSSSSGSALKEAIISTLLIDKGISITTNAVFGFTVTPAINSYSVEQLSNRERFYGSMNGIYTVPSSVLSTVSTTHSDGSWKITTTINLDNSHENHSINLHNLINTYTTIISQYNPTVENNISVVNSHKINSNLTHTYELNATIPTDYNTISNENRLAMTEAIENELSLYLGISNNNISTIITDIPTPFPFPMITKNKRLLGVNQKLSSGLSKNLVFNWR